MCGGGEDGRWVNYRGGGWDISSRPPPPHTHPPPWTTRRPDYQLAPKWFVTRKKAERVWLFLTPRPQRHFFPPVYLACLGLRYIAQKNHLFAPPFPPRIGVFNCSVPGQKVLRFGTSPSPLSRVFLFLVVKIITKIIHNLKTKSFYDSKDYFISFYLKPQYDFFPPGARRGPSWTTCAPPASSVASPSSPGARGPSWGTAWSSCWPDPPPGAVGDGGRGSGGAGGQGPQSVRFENKPGKEFVVFFFFFSFPLFS